MVKAADALAGAGHRVRMVSTRHVDWAIEADAELYRQRSGAWQWTVVDYHREAARAMYLRSGLRLRASRVVAAAIGPARCPLSLAVRAYSRVHPELVRAVLAEEADLVYGGTTGALAAVAESAQRAGTPYALDLEDFHSAEQEGNETGRLTNEVAARIEGAILSSATFLTTASPAIAAAYAEKYGVCPIPIHNTFPLPGTNPDLSPAPGEGLRLYWFSQTIGPRRGLEDVVRAIGIAGIPGELHLRGRPIPGYVESLIRLGAEVAPALKVVQHDVGPPDSMVELAAGYDVGLSVEQPHVLNRSLCLTNKAFTYALAGLAVVFTDTPGQRSLAENLGDGALLYAPGNVEALAAGLRHWAEDKSQLARAKAATWEAARRRWHWEHPEERGALLRAVAAVLDW
jgi:hypothetical protein